MCGHCAAETSEPLLSFDAQTSKATEQKQIPLLETPPPLLQAVESHFPSLQALPAWGVLGGGQKTADDRVQTIYVMQPVPISMTTVHKIPRKAGLSKVTIHC